MLIYSHVCVLCWCALESRDQCYVSIDKTWRLQNCWYRRGEECCNFCAQLSGNNGDWNTFLLWSLPVGYSGGGDGVTAPPPRSDRELLDNFCTVFVSFVSRLNCKIHHPQHQWHLAPSSEILNTPLLSFNLSKNLILSTEIYLLTVQMLLYFIIARHYTDARYWYGNSVHLSVCLSVRDVPVLEMKTA